LKNILILIYLRGRKHAKTYQNHLAPNITLAMKPPLPINKNVSVI